MGLLAVLALWIGCSAPAPDQAPSPAPTGPATEPPTDVTVTETGDSGAPTDTGTDVECDDPPLGPFPFVASPSLRTEEDFDFDIDGWLVSQDGRSLVARDRLGETRVLSPDIGIDAAGIRSLVTGDIVVAQPFTNSLDLVDHATGATTRILGGVYWANGVEATADGRVMSSELGMDGRIRLVDPYTGQAQVIASMGWPNNLALTPDERTLYVAASTASWGGDGVIAALYRDDQDAWSEPEVLYVHPETIGGITTDRCGHLYAVAYTRGTVFRIRAGDTEPELIADLGIAGTEGYSSLRFGHGIGAWGRTELFATNRREIFVMDVGIEGRHVLAGAEVPAR
jgi:hypothetical protein